MTQVLPIIKIVLVSKIEAGAIAIVKYAANFEDVG